MYDITTTRMIELYMEDASAPMFLSGFFQSPPRNFHLSEKVTVDVERDDEEVAIVITDLSAGARQNESSLYTNKGFTPPIFDEGGTITAYDQMKRQPGQDPFQDPNYAANAAEESFRIFRKLERKIRRAIELMASQVLQTGTVTCVDKDSNALYVLDFGAKATHLTDAGAAWGGGSEVPLTDLANLATVVRRDGKAVPSRLIFGGRAFQDFLADTEVQARLDNRNMMVGQVAPAARGEGATFQGWVWIGHYRFEMWTYDGFYRDPATGQHTPYVGEDRVIMMSQTGRLDLTFGAIPMMRRPDAGPLAFLPPRMSDEGRGLDLTTNAYFTPNGKHLKVEAGTRPLTIPTQIDSFGCLNTRP